jgi:glycosyltransferase involved in cell wall biosynthesis
MNRCKNEAERLGVRERIVFAGQQDDITTWFTKADIAIQSSNWEGFGLAAVEAMAVGLPTIASDVEGLRQVVEGAGLLFPKGDAKTLSKLILQTLTDNSVYQEISEKCRNRSLLYDIQNTANLYVSIYEEVVEE